MMQVGQMEPHKLRERKRQAKRVDIVTLKKVKESSLLYPQRNVKSPEDAYLLVEKFLSDADREHFLVVCLDTKNQPTAIHVCHVAHDDEAPLHLVKGVSPSV